MYLPSLFLLRIWFRIVQIGCDFSIIIDIVLMLDLLNVNSCSRLLTCCITIS